MKKIQKFGTIIVKNGEDIIESIDIVTSKDVEKRKIIDYLKIIGKIIVY